MMVNTLAVGLHIIIQWRLCRAARPRAIWRDSAVQPSETAGRSRPFHYKIQACCPPFRPLQHLWLSSGHLLLTFVILVSLDLVSLYSINHALQELCAWLGQPRSCCPG
jgi:hypothetical protein